jgi:hypothetical protein
MTAEAHDPADTAFSIPFAGSTMSAFLDELPR